MKCNKILVALSGGVDSSVCVYLMKQQGYDVTGLVLRLSPRSQQHCRSGAGPLRTPWAFR